MTGLIFLLLSAFLGALPLIFCYNNFKIDDSAYLSKSHLTVATYKVFYYRSIYKSTMYLMELFL